MNTETTHALAALTICVTSVCNARCATCFYWQNLNRPDDDMTLDEWRRVAATVPPVRGLQISGGEPTLDPDLVEKVALFVKDSQTTLALPTNGIKTPQIVERVAEIATRFPENRLIVGVSLDGPAAMHDKIRGVPGNFDRCLETLAALHALKREHPNLRLTTLTTLMADNADATPDLLRDLAAGGQVDFVTVEPLREQTPEENLEPPSLAQMTRIHELVIEINTRLLTERHPREMPSIVSHLVELFRAQRVVRTTGLLDFDCQAGGITGVLDSNGDVRLCELLDPAGNVRESGHDWRTVWTSARASTQRDLIRTRACSCTHCVNVGQSIALDPAAEARRRAAEERLTPSPA